ncbi:MAG: diadenylate cyclase domain-containing protein [Halobacteriota archaeon]
MNVDEVALAVLGEADVVLVFPSESSPPSELDDIEKPVYTVMDGGDVELPLDLTSYESRVEFGVEGALENELLEGGEVVVCVDEVFSNGYDTLSAVEATESMRSGIYDLLMNSKAEPDVVRDVVELAVELGRKGQKGEPIGALFVVGDAGKVMEMSSELSYNPFEKSHVHVGDPIVQVMLKEFSRLDGAFVISDGGKIVSAYRYLEASSEGLEVPKGLGTRHMAAASITRDTNAVSVVLSESDNMVRVFRGGDLVLELDPEEY